MARTAYSLILTLSLLACAGCASVGRYEWVNADKTPAQINQDQDECREVAQFSNTRGYQVGGVLTGTDTGSISDDFDNCMIKKGYEKQYKN